MEAREPSGFRRSDVRLEARTALALVHELKIPKTSTLGLLALILEHGLPDREHREALRAARLAEVVDDVSASAVGGHGP